MNLAKIFGAVVAAIAMVCVAPALGEEIDVPVENMHGAEAGTINVLTNGNSGVNGEITATYLPEGDTKLTAAAKDLWGGHLNWINIVVSGPDGSTPNDPDTGDPATFPLLDPLPGGNGGGAFAEVDADDLPFYLDENNTNDDGGPSAADYSDNASEDFGLGFLDRPQFNAEVSWKFNTYLAAIDGIDDASDTDKTFHIVAGFMWTFTQDAEGNRMITNLMAITIDNETITTHLSLVNTTMDKYTATEDWHATSHIPEPATLVLLLPIVLMRRRRCRRDQLSALDRM